MIYDRPYMRQPSGPEATKETTSVKVLLFITIGIFVLQNVLDVFFPGYGRGSNAFVSEWLAFSGQNFRELKVWTALSYGFLHSNATSSYLFIPIPFAHLVFNMLCLFLIGRHVERAIGKQPFLYFYLGSILVGGLMYLLFHFNDPQPMIGASAAIAAIVAFFCLSNPDRQMLIIPIPFPIKARWIFWGILVITLFGLGSELANKSNIAHSAHLGGILAGSLYFRFLHSGSNTLFEKHSKRTTIELPEWFKKKQKIEPKVTYQVNRSHRDTLQAEVDRILDKINTSPSGFGSLTADEKKTLEEATHLHSK